MKKYLALLLSLILIYETSVYSYDSFDCLVDVYQDDDGRYWSVYDMSKIPDGEFSDNNTENSLQQYNEEANVFTSNIMQIEETVTAAISTVAPSYSVKSILAKDSNNNQTNIIAPNGKLEQVVVTKKVDSADPANMLIALYKNKKLLDLVVISLSATATVNSDTAYPIDLIFGSDVTDNHIKIMIWDKLDKLTPFSTIAELAYAPLHMAMFNGNGNTGGTAPQILYWWENSITLPEAGTLVKKTADIDYIFGGWNTQPDGLGTHYASGEVIDLGSENTWFYAIWITRQEANIMAGEILEQAYYLDQILEPCKLSLRQIQDLPELGEGFYYQLYLYASQELSTLLEEAEITDDSTQNSLESLNTTSALNNSSGTTTEAIQFKAQYLHVSECAEYNNLRDTKNKGLSLETTYMFLSHFVDQATPTTQIDLDYCHDYNLNSWITNSDRTAYNTYLSQQGTVYDDYSLESEMKDILSLKNSTQDLNTIPGLMDKGFAKTMYKATHYIGSELDSTSSVTSDIINGLAALGSGLTAAQKCEFINETIELEEYDESTAKIVITAILALIGFVGGINGVKAGIAISAMYMSYIVPRYNYLYNHEAWLTLSASLDSRIVIRFYRHWEIE